MPHRFVIALALALSASPALSGAACYELLDLKSETPVYRGSRPVGLYAWDRAPTIDGGMALRVTPSACPPEPRRAQSRQLHPASVSATAMRAGPDAAGCYLLYDAAGQVLGVTQYPPFDISLPATSSAYEAARARGEHLVVLNPCRDNVDAAPIYYHGLSMTMGLSSRNWHRARSYRSSGGSSGGSCDHPDDRAADGSRCGARAASVRAGGRLGGWK